MLPEFNLANPQILGNVFWVGLEVIHVKGEHKNVAYQKVDLVIRHPTFVRILEQSLTFLTDDSWKLVVLSRAETIQ